MPNSLFPDNTFPDSTEFPFSIDFGKYGNVIYDNTVKEHYNHFSLNIDHKLDKEIKYKSKIENIRPPEKIYKPCIKRISKNVSENKTLQKNYFINNYGNEYVPDKLIETDTQNNVFDLYQGNVFQHFSLTKNQDYIIFPSNEITSDLSIIPISRKYKNSLNTSLNLNKTTLVPLLTPIKQITKPHIINTDEFLLSVRQQSKIKILKFCPNNTQIDDDINEEISENNKNSNKPDFKYQNIKELELDNYKYFCHITQNSYIPDEFLTLDNNNSVNLYNLELDELNTIYSGDKYRKFLFNRCDYLNHPKLASYINSSKLKLLDLRKKTKANTIYSLINDQFTAYSPHPTILNQIVASTSNHLMLFDIRYSKKAMLRWNHHQNQYYPTEISIIPFSQKYTDFSSDIIMTWNQYNIISAYCYDPINIKQSNTDTTVMPPSLSNFGTRIESYPIEHKPTKILEINENISLSSNSNVFYPQKSYLKGLDYSIFMFDTKEDILKKETTYNNQVGIKVFQYCDNEEIYYTTVKFSQSSKKRIYNSGVNDKFASKIEELIHHPITLSLPEINSNSKKYNKLKNKLRKKLIKLLDGMEVGQNIKTRALRRFEKLSDISFFDIKKLNHKKLKKHGKLVIETKKIKDKSNRDVNQKYSIISHSRYNIHPLNKYLNEMKAFNIINLSNVYRYMVYETRMSLKSEAIHGHIHMTKKKIMNFMEDSTSLVECNQKIKSLYEIHKRLSDIPIEYNNERLPFFLPSHHLSINLDWTNDHFKQSFLSYIKKIFPNTQITSNLLYISPRPDSIIDISNFASLFENLDSILPSPLQNKSKKTIINNKQMMAHSLVLAKVAYDIWSSSQVCNISFKPNRNNKRNINSTYEAFILENKKQPINVNKQDTHDLNPSKGKDSNQNSDNDALDGKDNNGTIYNNNTTNNMPTANYPTSINENSEENNTSKKISDENSLWLNKYLEQFKQLKSVDQSVFLPVNSLEDIEYEKNTEYHEDSENEFQKLLHQVMDDNNEQENNKTEKGNDKDHSEEKEEYVDSMVALTKPRFISSSISTYLIPAPGSAALLYDHWGKSSEEIYKEYKNLSINNVEDREKQDDLEYNEEWTEEEENEEEKYYISDSGDDEEVKFYKHPSNWNYYTKIKKMLEKMELEEKEKEIEKIENKNSSSMNDVLSSFPDELESSMYSTILDRKEVNSDARLLSSSSFFDTQENIHLLSSPQNSLLNGLPAVPETEENEYDSLDDEIKNINIDDVLKNVMSYSQREEEKTFKSQNINKNIEKEEEQKEEEEIDNLLQQDRSFMSQLFEETIQEKDEFSKKDNSKEKTPIKNSAATSSPSQLSISNSSKNHSLEKYPSSIPFFSSSQDSRQDSFSQPIFNSQPILPTNMERMKEASSPSSSPTPTILSQSKLKGIQQNRIYSNSQPSMLRPGMNRTLKQTTLSSTLTNKGKLLTIKHELPKVSKQKKKRRKYGF
ncbi:hypothetical protein BCR36DRAFT_402948 [Piromyces finnis]|uniref:Uncharacterized protein n=1 Tax=Piromyces finnis TaxID=1754191 RepID=A0A1Y1VFY8_9FUNG|nr:hypothetical protein BCR36DRAFT_402948 [Piromyces finnis]|eukprot:ORX55337.1 hypothetical protein BCR36DRAFT_402948 [Piromyces finnis]